jgi:hypothetical protein
LTIATKSVKVEKSDSKRQGKMSLEDEMKEIARQMRAERWEEQRLDAESEQIPIPLRLPAAKRAIWSVRNLKGRELIVEILKIPHYLIAPPGVENTEINEILEFLGCPLRSGFAHGYSARGGSYQVSSGWGFFVASKGIMNSFVEVANGSRPQSAPEAIAFLLKKGWSISSD